MLSEVAQIVNGGTPKSNIAGYWAGGVPWLTPKDMGRMDGREIATTPRTISEEGLANSSARLAPANSVILSTRAPIGHLAINMVPMAFNQGCRGIVPNANLDHVYLYYFLAANRKLLDDLGVGTTFKELSATNLRSVRLPLPPLDDQKRIVVVLDQAFAALDRASAHAEANLANAKELFDNARRQLLSTTGSGIATSLGDEIELLVGFAFKSSRYVEAGDSIRLLRGDNIVQGSMRWDDAEHWPADEAGDYDRFSLREGDVVLAMDRPWVKAGLKRALLRAEDVPALLVQRTACLRAGTRLDNRYLFQLISGDEFSRHLLGVQTGIGVPHISGQQIKDFTFTLPPLSEQRRIVSRLDELHVETKRLESCYARQLAALAALRQSLLQKAFAGQLT